MLKAIAKEVGDLVEDLRRLARAKRALVERQLTSVQLNINLTEWIVQVTMRLFFDWIQQPAVPPPSPALNETKQLVAIKLKFDAEPPDELQELRARANGLREELERAINICNNPTCKCAARRRNLQDELTRLWQRIDLLEQAADAEG